VQWNFSVLCELYGCGVSGMRAGVSVGGRQLRVPVAGSDA
jgi:hypothetical protein